MAVCSHGHITFVFRQKTKQNKREKEIIAKVEHCYILHVYW